MWHQICHKLYNHYFQFFHNNLHDAKYFQTYQSMHLDILYYFHHSKKKIGLEGKGVLQTNSPLINFIEFPSSLKTSMSIPSPAH